MAHATFPPSSSDKWLNCFGWYRATKDLPRSGSSLEAEEGTVAHSALELMLRFDLEAGHAVSLALLDSPFQSFGADKTNDMIAGVGLAYDYVISLSTEGYDYLPELSLEWGSFFGRKYAKSSGNARGDRDIPQFFRELTGTADVGLVRDDELIIVDLKYGRGKLVGAVNNTQMMTYQLGMAHRFGLREKYRNVIVQPRIRHPDCPIREHAFTKTELLAPAVRVEDAIHRNRLETQPRKAGSHCTWCAAAPTCKEYALNAISIATGGQVARGARRSPAQDFAD